ncbi:MAG: glycosyltransferase [Candidatus Cloacimonetes bacterium]|nr:glycosyltransferase [Candidatus Cloacimonadota bacterium]MBL7085915.1 glycosyltransferase [Candidatus Cloacimonadota bacterium]
MKIAILELHTHGECLYSFCKAFAGSEHQLTIYVNHSIYQELSGESFIGQFDWKIKKPNVSTCKFLKRNINSINKHEIVFIATVESDFRAYAKINFKPVTILRIHNANTWLNAQKSINISFSPYSLYKDMSYFIRIFLMGLDWYYKNNILHKVDYLTFPSSSISQYVQKQGLTANYKVGSQIPLAVYDSKFLKEPSIDSISITVPGGIDERRRDYKLLLKVWKQIVPEFKKVVQLNFLGKTKGKYGKDIEKAFDYLQTDNFIFKNFIKRIPQFEFNSVMKKTDILLSPILLDTRYKIYHEKYGYTKIAAIESDIMRYGKPVILHSEYPINKTFAPIIDQYDSSEKLAELLLSYINEDLLFVRTKNIEQLLENYKPEKIRKKIIYFFSSAVQKK